MEFTCGCCRNRQEVEYGPVDAGNEVKTGPTSKAHPRDLVSFFICGLLNNFGYVVMLSAALDMIKGSPLPPSVILLSEILPTFLVQLTAPFFMAKLPFSARILATVGTAIISFLIPALVESVWIKLVGVIFAGISSGFGEITFLSYSSYYHKNTVSAWSSGTGGAGILGSFSYLGLRYLLSPKWTLIVCSPLPVFMAVCFFFIMTRPEIRGMPNQQTSAIDHDFDTTKVELVNSQGEDIQPTLSGSAAALTMREKLRLMKSLLPYMIPLGIVYYAEYLINQSIAPVMLFPHSKLAGHEYEYYQAIYQIGVFLSRSSVNVVSIKSVWVLQAPALLQVLNAALLSLEAVFVFIPWIYIVFGIIFWEGLLGGAIYVNTFYLMSQKFEGSAKEFCMGATSMSYGLMITLSALTGIGYYPFLKHERRT